MNEWLAPLPFMKPRWLTWRQVFWRDVFLATLIAIPASAVIILAVVGALAIVTNSIT